MSKMKHIKLFEEFNKQIYEQVKTLPNEGVILIPLDEDVNITLQKTLFEMGFTWSGTGNDEILDAPNNLTDWYIRWKRTGKILKFCTRTDFYTSELIEFEDYFELKQEFRGHKLRKYDV